MAPGRFSQRAIITAHAKALRNRRYAGGLSSRRDTATVVTLYGASVGVSGLSVAFDWRVTQGEVLLAGVALLIGGGLSAFGQLAAWRSRLNQNDRTGSPEMPERHAIDEAVAHLLLATLVAVIEIPLLIVVSEVGAVDKPSASVDWIARIGSGVVFGLGTYLLLLLSMVLPKLYSAYVAANRLDDEMSGFKG